MSTTTPFIDKENNAPGKNFPSRAVSRALIWRKLSLVEQQETAELAQALRESGLVGDRKRLLISHRNVFVGSEAVSWMLVTNRASSVPEAVTKCQQLINGNFIHHINDEHEFANKHYFYRYRNDDQIKKGPSVGCLMKQTVMQGWLNLKRRKASLRSRRTYCVFATEGIMNIFYWFNSDVASTPQGFINFQRTNFSIQYSAKGKHIFHIRAISAEGKKVQVVAKAPNAAQLEAWVQSLVGAGAKFVEESKNQNKFATNSVYPFSAFNIRGQPVSMDKYVGKVTMIVNMPLKLDDRAQFAQLNMLQEKFEENGFQIIAFPCLSFGCEQEASLEREHVFSLIDRHSITYDVMDRIKINGREAHPLFQYLKSTCPGPYGTFIKDPFTKFLVDRNGKPFVRLEPCESACILERDISYLLSLSLGDQSSRTACENSPQTRGVMHDMATSPFHSPYSRFVSPKQQSSRDAILNSSTYAPLSAQKLANKSSHISQDIMSVFPPSPHQTNRSNCPIIFEDDASPMSVKSTHSRREVGTPMSSKRCIFPQHDEESQQFSLTASMLSDSESCSSSILSSNPSSPSRQGMTGMFAVKSASASPAPPFLPYASPFKSQSVMGSPSHLSAPASPSHLAMPPSPSHLKGAPVSITPKGPITGAQYRIPFKPSPLKSAVARPILQDDDDATSSQTGNSMNISSIPHPATNNATTKLKETSKLGQFKLSSADFTNNKFALAVKNGTPTIIRTPLARIQRQQKPLSFHGFAKQARRQSNATHTPSRPFFRTFDPSDLRSTVV